MPTILEKIADIEAEVYTQSVLFALYVKQIDLLYSICLQMARTQKNKATANHLGILKARLAKLRRELIQPKGGGGATGDGFDVAKTGDARVGFIGTLYTKTILLILVFIK